MSKSVRIMVSWEAYKKLENGMTDILKHTDTFLFSNICKERDPMLNVLNECNKISESQGYSKAFVTNLWEMPINYGGHDSNLKLYGEYKPKQ